MSLKKPQLSYMGSGTSVAVFRTTKKNFKEAVCASLLRSFKINLPATNGASPRAF